MSGALCLGRISPWVKASLGEAWGEHSDNRRCQPILRSSGMPSKAWQDWRC
jgi:hypothetical protein